MRDSWRLAAILAASLLPVSVRGQGMQEVTQGNPDSVFSQMRARLARKKYHEDLVDVSNRWMIVEAPGQKTKVEIRVEATHDSAAIKIEAVDAKDEVAGLQAIILVTADATLDPEKPGRPELFLSPLGRLWIARSGLFTTDTLMGSWRRSFNQSVSLGSRMAFVDEDTLFLGLPEAHDNQVHPRLYRSTDAGKSWSPVPTGGVQGVDALDVVGGSVWGFATYFDHDDRRTAFLRSADGGVTWTRAPLPPDLTDVTEVYRLTSAVGYVATRGDSVHPAFWRTTDGGASWLSIPTPRDQKVNDVPSYGVRIERIATVGEWLVVREYGKVFVTHPDTIRWRRLPDLRDIAADRERDHLFALTTDAHPEMLDGKLTVIWQCHEKIPRPDDIEGVLARDGEGYVWTGHGVIYEAHDGTLRVRQPGA